MRLVNSRNLILSVLATVLVAPTVPAAAADGRAEAPPLAYAQLADGGAADVDQQGTHRSTTAGPAIPGPDRISPIDRIEHPSRSARLVADSAGHLLLQGRMDTDTGSVERLVAVDPADGTVAWTVDGIEATCLPVATDDGRIFAQLVRNADILGAVTPSLDPVEIDAATGTIVNRYVSADTDAEPRFNECRDELRLGQDDILLGFTTGGDNSVIGIDTTTQPMTQAWATATPEADNDGGLDRTVLSPDGTAIHVGLLVTDPGPRQVRVRTLDVATGAVLDETVVPGTTFAPDGLLRTDDTLLVMTAAAGGQDDPPRLVALDADTLDQRWVLEGGDDDAFDRVGRMALADDVVVVHASGTLIGVALADGAVRWTAELSSFSNNGSQIISDGEGKVYVSTFGGAVLHVVDGRTGAPVFTSPDENEYLGEDLAGEATLGPVLPDGRLYAIHRVESGNIPALVAYGSGDARLDGTTGEPIDVAIQLCRYLFRDGGARTIVLSRDDVFADTLAGAPLAGDHSCILFTPGGPDEPLDPRTLDEIQRALPPGGTVRIAGGTNAVSSSAEQTLVDAGFAIERLSGPGRIDTAVAIADVVVAENPGADTAVVAFAGNWPDAVTAGAAASAIGAPVLLTDSDALPEQTSDALSRYGTRTTTVAGGTGVVSDAVLAQLPGPSRVAGVNRHATATAVAETLWDGLADERSFVLANLEFEQGWALALAAAPLSVRISAPQLGVRAADLPTETAEYLERNGITDPGLIVLGDVTVVRDEVVQTVRAEPA